MSPNVEPHALDPQLLPGVVGLYSPQPGSGKTTAALMMTLDYGYKVRPFAGPLKRMVRQFLRDCELTEAQVDGYMDEAKNMLLPGVWDRPVTPRRLMQTLGTEWGRQCLGENVWVRLWTQANANESLVVADDVRFPNEAVAIHAAGGEVWCVLRDTETAAEVMSHASEGQLNGLTFDRYLMNTGNLSELEHAIHFALKAHVSERQTQAGKT